MKSEAMLFSLGLTLLKPQSGKVAWAEANHAWLCERSIEDFSQFTLGLILLKYYQITIVLCNNGSLSAMLFAPA